MHPTISSLRNFTSRKPLACFFGRSIRKYSVLEGIRYEGPRYKGFSYAGPTEKIGGIAL